ncbi:MAG: hypothetical protein HY587_04200 [Candidatus Omnitrophica bacterium]|nr:hypothetical protein [Candidatus Omnitrophota bacterium]
MTEEDPLAFMRGEAVPAEDLRKREAVAQGIAVVLETDQNGKPTTASEELIGKTLELNSELGSRVTGCILGEKGEDYSKSFVHYGLDKIFFIEKPAKTPGQEIVSKLQSLFEKIKPELLIFPDTAAGRRMAARVAARLGTGLVTSVESMGIDFNDRSIEMTHTELQGKMRRIIVIREARPQMATLAAGCFTPARLDETVRSPVEKFEG